MQIKPKVNSTITHTANADGTLTFTVIGAGSFNFDPFKCYEGIQHRAALHGFIQRISDGGALGRDPDTGLPASPEAKMARMKRIAEHMESGTQEWNLRVAEGEGAVAGLTIMAMVESGLAANVDAADDLVAKTCVTKDIERKAALALWAKTDRVSAAMTIIRDRREATVPKMSSDALIAELMG